MSRGFIKWILVVAAAISPLGAQDPNAPPPPSGEPDGQYEPGRAVARISLLNGDVSVRRGDSGDVVAAAQNAPVMADDRLLTSSSGRAEIELDSANVVRIGPNSEVRFTAMDTRSFQIQVAAGTVTFRTLRPSQAQVEVDTPSVAVRPLRPGAYRVMVREDGTSQITVRLGQAEIDGQRGGTHLDSGQTMEARGPATDPEYQVVQSLPYDAFDRWNDDRDRYIQSSQSYQHVSPNVAGAEDLDQNGRWVNDPSYGSVWQPNVGPDWAPYQNGQWTWEDYYGWTWVSYDRWGWAPFHYGRWFWGAGGWAWYPGPVAANPFWAPAYVGFFGFGPGIGVGFGFGGLGWVALAPFEVFHPWWGHGFYGGFRGGFYGGHTTIVNNVNVYNSFRNARVTGGAIGMNAGAFGRGGSITALNRSQLASAGAVHGALPLAPDRASLNFSNRAASGQYPQARAQSFASRMQTPRVEHATFEQQQRGMQQISRGNFSQPAARGFGGGVGGGESSPGAGAGAAHGWSRFGEPIHGANNGGAAEFSRGYNPSAYGRPGYSGGAVRISPSIVQERGVQERGVQQRGFQERGVQQRSVPQASAPQPRSAPSYSAPRNYSQPRSFGGASRPSGGGGGHSGGGGGGGHHR